MILTGWDFPNSFKAVPHIMFASSPRSVMERGVSVFGSWIIPPDMVIMVFLKAPGSVRIVMNPSISSPITPIRAAAQLPEVFIQVPFMSSLRLSPRFFATVMVETANAGTMSVKISKNAILQNSFPSFSLLFTLAAVENSFFDHSKLRLFMFRGAELGCCK